MAVVVSASAVWGQDRLESPAPIHELETLSNPLGAASADTTDEEIAFPDTTHAVSAPTLIGPRTEGDTTATRPRRRTPGPPLHRRPVSHWEQPRWVMLRSLVLPGWGQWHNGSWLKAIGVAAGEGTLVYKIYDDHRDLDVLTREVQQARASGDQDREDELVITYNTRLDRYVGRQWLLGGVIAYALLDAYIDAHFRSFSVEFEGDPALPGGAPPSKQLRFSLRWHY